MNKDVSAGAGLMNVDHSFNELNCFWVFWIQDPELHQKSYYSGRNSVKLLS